jgi:hypothetical protein
VPDYVTPSLVTPEDKLTTEGRKPTVLYYFGRGRDEARALIQSAGLPEREVGGLNVQGLMSIFTGNKFFIYPCRQPGMDRTPREAAVNGCVVFVLREGAAEYYEDVPLPQRFVCDSQNAIKEALLSSYKSEEQYQKDFAAQREYREWLRGAPKRFEAGVDKLLATITA